MSSSQNLRFSSEDVVETTVRVFWFGRVVLTTRNGLSVQTFYGCSNNHANFDSNFAPLTSERIENGFLLSSIVDRAGMRELMRDTVVKLLQENSGYSGFGK